MPDPIDEQIIANVANTLATVTTANGYTGNLVVERPNTAIEKVSPTNLKTQVWPGVSRSFGKEVWGQIWTELQVNIVCYITESVKDNQAIHRYSALALADIRKALFVDRRRGGLCYIDNWIVTDNQTDPVNGWTAVQAILFTNFRTPVSDPTTLAPIAGNEKFFQGGAVLYLTKLVNGYEADCVRLSDLVVTPYIKPIVDPINSDGSGSVNNVAEEFTGYNEWFLIESQNFAPQFVQFAFGASPASTYNQSGSPVVGVNATVYATDRVIRLFDASGNRVYDIASIQSVKNGSMSYTTPTDWTTTADSLKEGAILIPKNSTIPPGTNVQISFTPNAATLRPVLNPQSAARQEYAAELQLKSSDGTIWSRNCGKVSIKPESISDDQRDLLTGKYIMTVLDDGTDKTVGQMLMPTGSIPNSGY